MEGSEVEREWKVSIGMSEGIRELGVRCRECGRIEGSFKWNGKRGESSEYKVKWERLQ